MAYAAFLLGGVLMYFACLRETPIFWRNEGGYPIWLRDTVLETFYPLFFLNAIVLLILSFGFLKLRLPSVRLWFAKAAVLLFLWCGTGTTVVIVLANNVSNLIEGRPIHSHEE